jgi:alkylhydroperoxidase family enzyme
VEQRGWVEPDQMNDFLDAGYSSQQALEVVLGIGLKTLSNYTNHLADTPLDEAFAGRAWQGSEQGQ